MAVPTRRYQPPISSAIAHNQAGLGLGIRGGFAAITHREPWAADRWPGKNKSGFGGMKLHKDPSIAGAAKSGDLACWENRIFGLQRHAY